MSRTLRLLLTLLLTLGPLRGMAQVNAQLFYDFGDDRRFTTLTLEMFKADKWGSTFFFVDTDFNYDKHTAGPNCAPGGSYLEIARSLNFWQKHKALAPWSLHVEYNGGITASYPINHAWLGGVEYFMHDATFRHTLTLQLLYKHIMKTDADLPFQFTAVWACRDLFGVKGLTFSGFLDYWREKHQTDFHMVVSAPADATAEPSAVLASKTEHYVLLTEPQLWYNVGRHFGVDNLHVGTEVELSEHFGSTSGFKCRPCLGAKWIF